MSQAYIYDAIRTPRGRAKDSGGLYDLTPLDLMKTLYDAMEQRTGIDKNKVEDVILGCVTQAVEQAANVAKTSLLYAGWPAHIPGITVNRFCSSGLDAINFAALKINAGQASMALAGGVEMMSRVPMLSDKASVFADPQLATRCRMLMMGSGADLIASQYDVSREEADRIAALSQQRAAAARDNGWFTSIIPVENTVKGITVEQDECIRAQTTVEGLADMAPSFEGLGAKGIDAFQLQANPDLNSISHVHTAGNSPAMADGAALVLVGDESVGEAYGIKPRAKIVAATSLCDDPLTVISGCAAATQQLMQQQGITSADVDLFELHEAFAATVVKCQRDLD
ncbi:MAG: acetyl-CoA C-acyltransferase, partial [Pseudomonadota bacterium]